ncbi:hypothetical protein GCM10009867_17170 [Pedococcus aerophilus]|uniref:Uncharacterized protein n=1 Tax=Pedococcus aerophilus TaxID=436356 RepID=A0ABN3UMU7_9MICO
MEVSATSVTVESCGDMNANQPPAPSATTAAADAARTAGFLERAVAGCACSPVAGASSFKVMVSPVWCGSVLAGP